MIFEYSAISAARRQSREFEGALLSIQIPLVLLMALAATPCPGLEVVPPRQLSRHLCRLLVDFVPFFLRHRRDNQIQIFVPALRVLSLGSSYLFAFQGKGLAVWEAIFPWAPNERAVKPRSWQ